MIILEPSLGAKKEFHYIDFDLLSIALTAVTTVIFGKQFNKVIRVFKSKTGDDFYLVSTNTIYLRFGKRSFSDVMSTIVHETRHWLQDYVFKTSFRGKNYDDSTYELYKNSKLEKDARRFEEVYTEVARVYSELQKIQKLNERKQYNKIRSK